MYLLLLGRARERSRGERWSWALTESWTTFCSRCQQWLFGHCLCDFVTGVNSGFSDTVCVTLLQVSTVASRTLCDFAPGVNSRFSDTVCVTLLQVSTVTSRTLSVCLCSSCQQSLLGHCLCDFAPGVNSRFSDTDCVTLLQVSTVASRTLLV